jgi:hypothetical protein
VVLPRVTHAVAVARVRFAAGGALVVGFDDVRPGLPQADRLPRDRSAACTSRVVWFDDVRSGVSPPDGLSGDDGCAGCAAGIVWVVLRTHHRRAGGSSGVFVGGWV